MRVSSLVFQKPPSSSMVESIPAKGKKVNEWDSNNLFFFRVLKAIKRNQVLHMAQLYPISLNPIPKTFKN